MTYKQARKLHNADEVTHKSSGQVCRVVQARDYKKVRLVEIDIIHPDEGFLTVTHVQVS